MLPIYTMKFYLTVKRKRTIDRCSSMDETQKHYGKQSQPERKECVLYDAIYLKFEDMKTNVW